MAAPRRNLPDQDPKLSRRTASRAAPFAIVLAALAAVPFAQGYGVANRGEQSARAVAVDLASWVQIVADLQDAVPARLLLGGSGPDEALDAVLRARGFTRSEFALAAATAIRTAGESAASASDEALAAAAAAYPWPEGVEFPGPDPDRTCPDSADTDEARRLVLALTARLGSNDPAAGPETERP